MASQARAASTKESFSGGGSSNRRHMDGGVSPCRGAGRVGSPGAGHARTLEWGGTGAHEAVGVVGRLDQLEELHLGVLRPPAASDARPLPAQLSPGRGGTGVSST